MKKKLSILGIRGVPANHGGFETFAEHLSLYLRKQGWEVTVYCQVEGKGTMYSDEWKGIRRINIPTNRTGALGTIFFDWKSTLHAAKSDSLILTLGYNTAIFSLLYRLNKNINLINMDGIEWKRDKWSLPAKAWLYINERAGCYLGNHLIADHPEIKNHLSTRVSSNKVTMIPYGSDEIVSGDDQVLTQFNLNPNQYALVVARPEPENSILEIVSAFSKRKRGLKLVVLGDFSKGNIGYCSKVIDTASDEVIFPGAIYDKNIVKALRYFALIYIHGHQVGGTNPSLVEALGAKNPVLAHDNAFNKWVAGSTNAYFSSADECDTILTNLLYDHKKLEEMRQSSEVIHRTSFTWESILSSYEDILTDNLHHST